MNYINGRELQFSRLSAVIFSLPAQHGLPIYTVLTMGFLVPVLALTASLFSLGAAAAAPPGAHSTHCYSRMALTPARHINTYWFSHYTPCSTATARITVRTTKTPETTKTVTATKTHTLVAPDTDKTITSFTTTVSTSTSMIVTTSLSAAPAVTGLSTATVPTPAGFTPVRSSLPGSSYGGLEGRGSIEKERTGFSRRSPEGQIQAYGGGIKGHKRYLQGIDCHVYAPIGGKCSAKTLTVTSTATAPKVTVRKTITATVTTVYCPSAAKTMQKKTITSTITSISVSTLTSTTVSVTTPTVASSVTTVYAACATDNMADRYQGAPFLDVAIGAASSLVDSSAVASAYECCVAALLDPAGASVWAFEPNAGGGDNCFIGQTSGRCPAPGTDLIRAITFSTGDLVVGNSHCGEIGSVLPAVPIDN